MSKAIQRSRESRLLLKKNRKQTKQGKLAGDVMAALFSYAVFILLGLANVLLYDSVFELEGRYITYFCLLAGIGLLLMLCYKNKRLGKKTHFVIAAFYLAGGILLRNEICKGGQLLLNSILREFGDCHGIYVPTFKVIDAQATNQTAAMFVAAVLLWWIAIGMFCIKNAAFSLLPSVVICCMEMLVGKSPEQFALFFTILCGMGVIALCKGSSIKDHWGIQKIRAKSGTILVLVIACCLWMAAVFGNRQAAMLVEKFPEMLAYQKELEERITGLLAYGAAGKREGALSNEAPEYENVTVMQVAMQKQPEGTYYLRGYVGDTYKNGRWTSTAGDWNLTVDGKEILNLLYCTQQYQTQGILENMTIRYLDEESDYAYFPYQADLDTIQLSGGTGEVSYIGDASLLRNGADTLTISGDLTGLHLENVSIEEQDGFPATQYEEISTLEEAYQKRLEGYLQFPSGLSQLKDFGEELAVSFEEKMTSDSRYYASGLSREALAAYMVQNEIAERTSYSLDLNAVPAGEDIVQYFLFGSGEGFCQHYASAGTLLLRSLGIPARYVTGYIVSAEEFKLSDDGTYIAEVKDSRAHAWVEYYQPGVGWVPIDMTEGSNQAWNEYSLAPDIWNDLQVQEQQNAGMEEVLQQELEQSETEQAVVGQLEEELQQLSETEGEVSENKEEMHQNDSQNQKNEPTNLTEEGGVSLDVENGGKKPEDRGFVFFLKILGFVGTVIAIILLIYGTIRYRDRRIFKEFCQKNYRRAVKSVSYHVYHLLLQKGIIKDRHMDDRAYRKQFLERVTVLSEEDKLCYLEILRRAYYSNEELERTDAIFCRKVYKKIKLLK